VDEQPARRGSGEGSLRVADTGEVGVLLRVLERLADAGVLLAVLGELGLGRDGSA